MPTAVLLTAKDRAVDVASQLRMALLLPEARVFTVAEGHLGVLRPEFCAALVEACGDVAARVEARCSGEAVPAIDGEPLRTSE